MIKHKLIKHSCVFTLLFFSFASQAQQAPAFSLPGDAQTISLQNLKGKVIYLDFWASWCDPCRKSFPWMNTLLSRYDNDKFEVIAVNLDASRQDAEKFLAKQPANFTVAYDPDGKVASQYQLQAMPSSYLIDKKGNLVFSHKGYREGDTAAIEEKIRELVNSR